MWRSILVSPVFMQTTTWQPQQEHAASVVHEATLSTSMMRDCFLCPFFSSCEPHHEWHSARCRSLKNAQESTQKKFKNVNLHQKGPHALCKASDHFADVIFKARSGSPSSSPRSFQKGLVSKVQVVRLMDLGFLS